MDHSNIRGVEDSLADYYEALGFPRRSSFDQIVERRNLESDLKDAMALALHKPSKNIGLKVKGVLIPVPALASQSDLHELYDTLYAAAEWLKHVPSPFESARLLERELEHNPGVVNGEIGSAVRRQIGMLKSGNYEELALICAEPLLKKAYDLYSSMTAAPKAPRRQKQPVWVLSA